MRARILAWAGVLALPATAVAADTLTATGARVGDHPGYVRVVVDFAGGRVELGEVTLGPAGDLYRQGRARLALARPRVRTRAKPVRGQGVSVRLSAPRRGRIDIALRTAQRRFKAIEEHALHGPERLVLDLWRAAPPSAAATVRADGCLALDAFTIAAARVRASGRALRPLFENSLVVEVRAADGRSAGSRSVTAAERRWRASVPYRVRRAEPGTLEAAVYSARDGSLECLVQVPVRLRPA